MALGQAQRPSTTTAEAIVTVTNRRITVHNITIGNVTSSPVSYRVFRARSGEAYDEDTALFWDIPLDANQTEVVPVTWYLLRTGDNIGVRSSAGNAITFIVDGVYIDET